MSELWTVETYQGVKPYTMARLEKQTAGAAAAIIERALMTPGIGGVVAYRPVLDPEREEVPRDPVQRPGDA